MAESFNSWILGPRHKTIITMLEEIRIKVMRRIGQLREFCDTWITNISPMALKSTNTSVIPPVIKTLPGRPRKCRRKEHNENKTGKLSKRGVEMTSSLWHAKGHNKRGCHLNNQANTSRERGKGRGCETSSTRSSVGSFRAPTESQSSTKRGRGRPRASATGRGRETTTGNKTGIGVAADDSGATGRERGTGTGLARRGTRTGLAGRGTRIATGVVGRGRGTGVAATATDVPGATGGGKRPRMVGMGILHTQSGFTIHNPEMPMNSSIVTGNLGHHKPRSGLKWKGKADVTQQGLQEMRENKRMRTKFNVAEV
ncbi:hypothetical protein KY284_007560 [Solanum tuberosum]|nr:hypothetical protein KY284_007560 [Solanum tuberosum]